MTTAMAGPGPDARASERALLGDPELRRFLREYVKKRVQPADVDDVVQTVLVEALASSRLPAVEAGDPTEVRKWLVGIARHKCADVHRRAGRERPSEEELPDLPTEAPPLEERALVRWAEEQALSTRDADKTLGWMAREGEGDKLEHIAEEESLPPARVRQRVSRMRRLLKERWLAELALVAALGAICLVLWRWLRKEDEGPIIADPMRPIPSASPSTGPDPVGPGPERLVEGRRLRGLALEACAKDEPQRCLEGLDRAKELDPEGDAEPTVGAARERAIQQLEQNSAPQDVDEKKSAPAPTAPSSLPTGSLPQAPPKAPPKAPPTQKSKAPFLGEKGATDLDSEPRSAPSPLASGTATQPAPAPAPPVGPGPNKPAPPTKAPASPKKPGSSDDLMQQMRKGAGK